MRMNVDQAYRLAAERYQECGVDTESALARLKAIGVAALLAGRRCARS
jgi:L-rhamnose isomerase